MTIVERLHATGIRRHGSLKHGFRYRHAGGRRASPPMRRRIQALRIPPAWRDVAIHPSPRSHVQAVGRDAAGRWQYLYHDRQVVRRERRKSERLLHFIRALPRMRCAITRDLARSGLPREKVLACILRILSTCFLRPGSQVYADENRSYGIATLRRGHVAVRGDRIRFDFPGKSRQRQQHELIDRAVARIVRELIRRPGIEVFKFVNGEGRVVDVRRRHINEYIKQVMGERFSAKDFRTWAGTLVCACALARVATDRREALPARRHKVSAAVRETAAQLGNTPAICRASYINPEVLEDFLRGRIIGRHFSDIDAFLRHRGQSLHASERALLTLLERSRRT